MVNVLKERKYNNTKAFIADVLEITTELIAVKEEFNLLTTLATSCFAILGEHIL